MQSESRALRAVFPSAAACDTSYCPKPVACPKGSHPILTYEEGACCPHQNCSECQRPPGGPGAVEGKRTGGSLRLGGRGCGIAARARGPATPVTLMAPAVLRAGAWWAGRRGEAGP